MLTFDIARSLEDVLEAWRLLYEVYLRAGFIRPNADRLHIAPQAIGPDTLVVLARREDRIVGTISAIMDGRLGLPLDYLYPEELNALHTEDRCFCEFGLLCQATGSVGDLWSLIRYAYYFAIQQGGTDCVCGIPPERTSLYCRLFGFRPIGEARDRTTIVDNPVQLIHVSAEHVRQYHARHRALSRIVQNPLAPSSFKGRFAFAPEALAGSALEKKQCRAIR